MSGMCSRPRQPSLASLARRNLEKQVESGNMRVVDEKRALQEIQQLKRSRRTVESFQADQESIEADRAKLDELRKQLDDPEFKAISDRYDTIKAELDEIKRVLLETNPWYLGLTGLVSVLHVLWVHSYSLQWCT